VQAQRSCIGKPQEPGIRWRCNSSRGCEAVIFLTANQPPASSHTDETMINKATVKDRARAPADLQTSPMIQHTITGSSEFSGCEGVDEPRSPDRFAVASDRRLVDYPQTAA
jgi:hypothetical protein